MVTAAALPKPGVKVIQKVKRVSPTVLSPSLVPVILGVAKQTVDLFTTNASGSRVLNGDANIQMPAVLIAKAGSGSPAIYTGLNGLTLNIGSQGLQLAQVVFSDSSGLGLTPATIVSQVQTALTAAGVSSLVAETYGTDAWCLRTLDTGDFAELEAMAGTHATILSTFGWAADVPNWGFSLYHQYGVTIPQMGLPDPKGNLDQLSVETDTVRVFFATGTSNIVEARRNTSVLQFGSVAVPAASAAGSVDLTTPPALINQHLLITVDGVTQEFIFPSTPVSGAALLTMLNNATTGIHGLTASLNANHLVFTHQLGGYGHTFTIGTAGTSPANAALGIAAATYVGTSIQAVDDGDGNALTSIIDVTGQDFTRSVGTAAVLTASTVPTTPLTGTLVISDGQQPRTVTFTAAANIAAIVTAINDVCGTAAGGKLTASSDAGKLALTHSDVGFDSHISIVGGTAFPALDPGATPTIAPGISAYGQAAKPVAGDEVWVDGTLLGIVTRVAPGGVASRLKLDRYFSISVNIGTYFYLVANKLTNTVTSTTRPAPELAVAADGSIRVKQDIVRDWRGVPVQGAMPVYVAYRALRLDLSPRAKLPGITKLQGSTAVTDALAPISTENPFGLGMYLAALNAPGVQISGCSVPAASSDEPYGTAMGFAEVATYMEAFEVYALAPLTHDVAGAGQILAAHVDAMSDPDMRGERMVILNPGYPSRKADTLVASGTGDAATSSSFDTRVPNLPTFVSQAGITTLGTIPASAGLFLDVASDNKRYSVSSISSGMVYLRTSFAAGENDDGFYSTSALTLPLIQETYALKVRGASLTTTTGALDRDGIADAISATAAGFANRRVWMLWPDSVRTSVLGTAQRIEGFYAAACIAGMIAQNSPAQSFTNFPMVGLDGVYNTTNVLTTQQLDRMAANGVYILEQPEENAAVVSRMAVTTDMTSVETRTDSILKILDYTSKQIRMTLRGFMGRNNISQGFIDSLNTILESVGSKLKDQKILNDFIPGSFTQDTTAIDTLMVSVILDAPIPCNYLEVTLVL